MRSQMEDVRIRLSLEFELKTRPKLIDVSALLYDLELLHDFTILVSSEEDYQTYKFSRYFWYRAGRPIREEQKLRSLRISKQSPLTLELLVGANLVTTAFIAFLESSK